MKYYIVGTAESLTYLSFLYTVQEKDFSQKDLFNNLSQMDEIPFFESQIHAFDYARSLRIQRQPKTTCEQKVKFAPVIEIECDDEDFLTKINRHTQQFSTITYIEYVDKRTYLGNLRERQETINCKMIPLSNSELNLLRIESVLFPDSGRDNQRFNKNQSCTLM